MKIVQNNVVSMNWDAEGFIETKSQGFISAIHVYNGVPVVFRDGKIYQHIDVEEQTILSQKELVGVIKSAVREKDRDYPWFYDDYAEIFDGIEFSDALLDLLGIAEFKDDMKARLEDLSGYWQVDEVPIN